MSRALKIAGWLVIALAAVLALYVTAAGFVVSKTIDRLLTPGSLEAAMAQAPAPTNPFELGYQGDPAKALGLKFETIALPGELGVNPAWLAPGADGASVWAIYVHGVAGLRENGYRHLSVLHEAGVPTLLISYRNDEGAPPSPDRRYGFGLGEWRDVEAAVAFAESRGAQQIILIGESMGGGIVGQFLSRSPRADAVAAVALDSPALDFPAVIKHLFGKRFPLIDLVAPVGMEIRAIGGGMNGRDAVTLDVLRDFRGPLFVAHGTGDRVVPVSISDNLVTSRHGAATYLRCGGDHLQCWKENPALYRAQFRNFLDLVLTPAAEHKALSKAFP